MKRKNVRSLDEIADEIHKLDRTNIFQRGELLIEAQAQCERLGQRWLDWLSDEFEQSEDTAERLVKVAHLGLRFRKLRNLKLAKTTFYALADHDKEDELPAIIAELSKHASKKNLKPRDAARVIKVGIGRHRYGDHPDATLVALAEMTRRIEGYGDDTSRYQEAVDVLLERDPATDEGAKEIIDAAVDQGEFESDEVASILDGPPPELPSLTTPPDEPQKLSTETDWAETALFTRAVNDLRALRSKPIARFRGQFTKADLRPVVDFLMNIEAAEKSEAACETPPP